MPLTDNLKLSVCKLELQCQIHLESSILKMCIQIAHSLKCAIVGFLL